MKYTVWSVIGNSYIKVVINGTEVTYLKLFIKSFLKNINFFSFIAGN
jgi:hypothetical protein